MSFSSNPELRKRAMEVFEELYAGGHGDSMTDEYQNKSTDYADMSLEWCIGGLLGRPGLDMKTREFIAFVLCAADGRIQDAVLAHAEALLRCGATKKEIYEAVLMMVWYTGASPVSMALTTLADFFGDEDLS